MIPTLIAAALSFPTVLWTVALGFLMLYWLLVAGGALDVESLGGADAAADAGGAALESSGLSDAAGLLSRLGLRQVPVTVLATLLALLNFLGCHYALKLVGPMSLPGGAALALAVLLLSLPVAAALSRPLKPLFHVHEAPSRASLIGKVGVVCTGRVDDRFGQARIDDGGAGLIVEVRAPAAAGLEREDRVLLVAWDTRREAFDVEREDALLNRTPS